MALILGAQEMEGREEDSTSAGAEDLTFQCLDGGQGECFFLLKLIPNLTPGCFEIQLYDLLDMICYSDFQIFQLGR